jgi:hypothetical protein
MLLGQGAPPLTLRDNTHLISAGFAQAALEKGPLEQTIPLLRHEFRGNFNIYN